MATYMFYPPAHMLGHSSADINIQRQGVQNLRNIMRSGWGSFTANLNKALPSPRWVVSDIGRQTTSSERGYYFVVRDTTEGCEWCIVYPADEAMGNQSEDSEHFIGSTNVTGIQYTHNTPGSGASVSPGPLILFSPDYATFSFTTAMGFDNTTALTYTGGDFTTVAVPPTSLAAVQASWLWNGDLKAFQGQIATGSGMAGAQWAFVINEEEAALMMLALGASTADFYGLGSIAVFSKRLFIPRDALDTYTWGGTWLNVGWVSNQAWAVSATAARGAMGYTAAGVFVDDYDVQRLDSYTADNYLDGSGNVRWRLIPVVGATDDKGALNPKIMRELGEPNRYMTYGMHFEEDGQPLCALANRVACMYPANVPVFPFHFSGYGTCDKVIVP